MWRIFVEEDMWRIFGIRYVEDTVAWMLRGLLIMASYLIGGFRRIRDELIGGL